MVVAALNKLRPSPGTASVVVAVVVVATDSSVDVAFVGSVEVAEELPDPAWAAAKALNTSVTRLVVATVDAGGVKVVLKSNECCKHINQLCS